MAAAKAAREPDRRRFPSTGPARRWGTHAGRRDEGGVVVGVVEPFDSSLCLLMRSSLSWRRTLWAFGAAPRSRMG